MYIAGIRMSLVFVQYFGTPVISVIYHTDTRSIALPINASFITLDTTVHNETSPMLA